MATTSDHLRRVRSLDWNGLAHLWSAVRAGRTPGWEPGKAFEHLVLRAFELDGADVRWPYVVRFKNQLVEQIDGAVYAAGLSCIVEAKDSAFNVNVEAIAKMRHQLSRRPAGVVGLLFSRTLFTEPAVTLAQFLAPQNILLWTGDDLTLALERRAMTWALEMKYRHSVEEASPRYNLQEGL